ncbi:MAG: D-hexose-6-phosphate mutarotase [Phycisphaerales bacterium]|nr:D-hexose-6-phosphate mutarotase [Phycisphaerales bacterium]
MTIAELQSRFALDGVTIRPGHGGLPTIVIHNPSASAEVYCLGATVTHYAPKGHEPILFVSQKSHFQEGKAIRGGIPICWPWFGPKPDDPGAPQHGLVRSRLWQVDAIRPIDDLRTELQLSIRVGDLAASCFVRVGPELQVSLRSENLGTTTARLEEALHTYLRVGDSRQVRIEGLAGVDYIDKVAGQARKQQPPEPVTFVAETDRVYLNTESPCVLIDPVLRRRITIDKSGSRSTVVWNPWIDKSRTLTDFGDEEWQQMCCIETANVADNHLLLSAGQAHAISATIRVERL